MTVRIEKPAINVREELADLRKPTGLAGEAMLRAETPQEQFNLIGAGRRNWIINGDFAVTQRGDYSSSTSVASGAYSVDRWKSNDPFNLQRFTGQVIDGIRTNYVKVSYNGTASMGFMQLIEDKDYEVLRGQTITISAYVRTNQALFGFRLYDGSQKYGPRFVADGNWHRATWTFTWSPSSPSYFNILFDTYQGSFPTIGSGDYMDIAMVQVELGKVATPFEHRSYGEELALCQRYYQKHTVADTFQYIGNVAVAHTSAIVTQNWQLNPTMRAAPQLANTGWRWKRMTNGLDNVTITGTTLQDATANDVNVAWTVGSTTVGYVGMIESAGTSSAYIAFDAEL
jgi:hypothetical protein